MKYVKIIAIVLFAQMAFGQNNGLLIEKYLSSPTTTVQSGETFKYVIEYSIYDTTLNNIQLIDEISDKLDITQVNYNSSIWSLSQSGNDLMFDFIGGNVNFSGVIEIQVRFKIGETCDGAIALNEAVILGKDANQNIITEQSELITIEAEATNKWLFNKYHDAGNVVDNQVVYEIRVQSGSNDEIGGYNLTNPIIKEYLPNGVTNVQVHLFGTQLTLGSDYTINGNVIEIPTGNLNVSLGFSWKRYYITMTFPSSQYGVGDIVTNTADLEFEDPCGNPGSLTSTVDLELQEVQLGGTVSKFVSENSVYNDDFIPGCSAYYTLSFSNTSNVPLGTTVLEDILPANLPIKITDIFATTSDNSTSMILTYDNNTSSGNTITKTITGNSMLYDVSGVPMNGNGSLDMTQMNFISPTVNLGESITIYIYFEVLHFDVSNTVVDINYPPIVNCINTILPNGTVLNNCSSFEIEDVSADARISKYFVRSNGIGSTSLSPVTPGDKIRYRLQIRSTGSTALQNIEIMDELDPRLTYCGNETYYFGPLTNPNSSLFNTNPPSQIGTMTSSVNGQEIAWNIDYLLGECNTRNNFFIEFDVMVKTTASTQNGNHIPNFFTLTSSNSNALTSPTRYFSVSDFTDVYPTKYVKNQDDIAYNTQIISQVGNVIEYQLNLSNVGNTQLKDLIMIDLLPFNNDFTILNGSSRGSQFGINMGPSGVIPPLGFTGTIDYSSEVSPDYGPDLGLTYATPGTNPPNWTTINALTAPVRGIRITYDPSFILYPGDTESFTFSAIVPVGTAPDLIACNSFAFVTTSVNSGNQLQPSEFIGACITVDSIVGCCIGDFVWDDTNDDGIQTSGEPGLNNITVNLYNSNFQLEATTISSDNDSGDPGFYSFCGLADGTYYINIDIPSGYYLSGANAGNDDDLDSDIDNSGFSSGITIAPNTCQITNLDIGINTVPPDTTDPYQCEACDSICSYIVGNNLVTNPDFSNGFTGYTTELTLGNCSANRYQIVTTANQLCSSFPSTIFDHTSGDATGSFMAIDGFSSSLLDELLLFNVPIVAGKEYDFSFWVTNFVIDWDDVIINVEFDGSIVNTIDMEDIPGGQWTRLCTPYTAATTGTLQIRLVQSNFASIGIDFGLDDICFSEVESTPFTVDIGPDKFACQTNSGKVLFLNSTVTGGGNNFSYSWNSPTLNLFNSSSAAAQTDLSLVGYHQITLQVTSIDCGTTATDTMYIEIIDCSSSCSCDESCYTASNNLINNGHFEFGYVNFTSQLTMTTGNVCNFGFYMIGNEPSDLCSNFSSGIYDHTFGTSNGEFLLIDGHPNSARTVYQTSINFNSFTNYDLNFWYLLFNNGADPEFDIVLDNYVVASITTDMAIAEVWTNYCITFNSLDYSGLLDLKIVQTNSGGTGYDYGLDDICLSALTSSFTLETDTTQITVCPGSLLDLEVTPVGNNGSVSYLWKPATHITNLTGNQTTFSAQFPGQYIVTVYATDSLECETQLSFVINVDECPPVCDCPEDNCIGEISNNLIANGNFEQGTTGFTSDLPLSSSNCVVGSYSVQNTPYGHCTSFSNTAYDVTLGTPYGHMMVIDGSSNAVVNVLKYNIFQTLGEKYRFSFHFMSFSSQNYSLDVLVDGVIIGNIPTFSLPGNLLWDEFCFEWIASSTGNVEVAIRQNNPNGGGRDYAFDEACIVQITDAVSVNTPDDITICLGSTIVLTSDIQAVNSNYICDWSASPNLDNTNLCNPTYTANSVGVETLVIDVNLADSCYVSDSVTITVVDCSAGCFCPNDVTPISELVINGDFESGGTGFSSTVPEVCGCQPGSWCVTTNARAKCTVSGWADIFPPAGAGNYLVMDGSQGSVWSQVVNATAGNTYNFKFDVYPNISGSTSPTLRMVADGFTVLNNITPTLNQWSTISATYVATTSGPIIISIDQTNNFGNNDYGLDNICFTTCSAGTVCEDNKLENGTVDPGQNFGQYDWGEYSTFWTAIRKYSGNPVKVPYVEVEDGCTSNNAIELTGNLGAGDGVWQKFNFNTGGTYDLSYCAKWLSTSVPNARIRFRAVNSPALVSKYVGYSDCSLPECQEIELSANLTDGWVTYTAPGFTPMANFNTLVVTAENDLETPKVEFMSKVRVDNICVNQVSSEPCNSNIFDLNYNISCVSPGDDVLVTWTNDCPDEVVGRLILIYHDINTNYTTEYDVFNHGSFLYPIPDYAPTGNFRFYIEYEDQSNLDYGPIFQIDPCCQSCPDEYDVNLKEGGTYTLREEDVFAMRNNECLDSFYFSENLITCADLPQKTVDLTTFYNGDSTTCTITLNITDKNGKCCPDMLMYEDYLQNDGCYNANNLIMTNGIIFPGKNIQYMSGGAIKLTPGFEIKKGAVFKTEMKGCMD